MFSQKVLCSVGIGLLNPGHVSAWNCLLSQLENIFQNDELHALTGWPHQKIQNTMEDYAGGMRLISNGSSCHVAGRIPA
jgi:hypothetical protein